MTGVSSITLSGSFATDTEQVLFLLGSLLALLQPSEGRVVFSNSPSAGCSVSALLSSAAQASAQSLHFQVSEWGVPSVPMLAGTPLVAASNSTASCWPAEDSVYLSIGLASISTVHLVFQDGSSETLVTATGEIIARNAGSNEPPPPIVTGLSPGMGGGRRLQGRLPGQ